MTLTLQVLPDVYDVLRLTADAVLTSEQYADAFSITKTADETSVVCVQSISAQYAAQKQETGFVCFKILGPLDFGLTGILAEISTLLANAKISIFAISTFDTDYVFVRQSNVTQAIAELNKNYTVIPAKAGIQSNSDLDSRFCGSDA